MSKSLLFVTYRFQFPLRKICLLLAFILLLVATSIANNENESAAMRNSYFRLFSVPSSTTLAANINPSCFGTLITLTATVTPGAATGLVQFYDGVILIGASALSGGIATLSTAVLTPGSHSLTAVYAGDLTYTTSTSPVLTQSVDAATPLTPGAITGATPVCPTTTQAYSVSAVLNATTYNWTLPAGWVINSGAGTNAITVTVGLGSGNITVTAGNACGTSAAQTKAVVANPPIPATPGTITGPTSVCPSVTGLNYTISAVPNATTYTWAAPAGFTVTAGPGTVSITYSTTAGAVSGNISVAAVNGCGSSAASQTINITPVNATDNTGYTDGTTKFSDGLTVATNTLPARRGYLKFPLSSLSVIPVGSTISSILKLTNNVSAVSGGNFVNALGTNDPVTTPANTLFTAAGTGANYNTGGWAATGQINLTLNAQANTDIANNISSPGYLALGLVRASTGTAVSNFWGYSAGANVPVLSVTYASLRNLAVTVNPPKPATPGSISGPSSVCPNSIGNVYSITAVTNATTYTWIVPAGWTITSGQGTISITVSSGATGGNITVTAGNSCGTSTASPAYAVTIGVLPTVSASPISQETCSGMPIGTITCSNPNSVAGTTYSWVRDNVFTTGMAFAGTTPSTITGTLTNILTTQQTSTFTIYAVSGIGCISASPVTVTVAVNASPVANAGIDQTSCAATSVTIGGTPTGSGGTPGYTYLWTAGVSNTAIANPTAPPGTYTVTVTDSKGCSASDAVTISTGSSGTKTWIGLGTSGGGPDNNFNNALNWSPGGVPGACNDVVINMDIFNIFNVFSGALTISLSSSVTIKSLTIDIGGTTLFSSATYFKLYTGSNNTLNILNNTSLNTHTSGLFSAPAGGYISVGPGGVITYGGSLTTLQSNNCQNYPFYADVNAAGKMYLNGNAALAGIGNDPANKPGQIVFNGTGTQTITNSSGTQPIYLAATNTIIGETNSPTVVLAGAGTNGFRNIGDLTINNSSTLDIGTTQTMNRNAAGGSINMAAGTFMKIGKSNGGVGSSNFPSNFSSFSFNPTSTVDYNAPAGQTVFATPLYGNLTLSTSGNKTITANTTVQKNITIQGTAILQAGTFTTVLGGNWTNYGQVGFSEQTSTIDFNGSGAQAINTTGGDVFYTLNKSGTGTTTLLSDVAVQGGGTSSFTLSNGTFDAGTFTFNSAASTFNISSGLLKLAKTGATLLPEFVIASYNLTGGTIELYGAGDQVLRGSRAYRNLTFSTSGIKTISSAITSITGTVLTQNSVTLDVSNNTMGGAGTNLTMTGTSLYKTAGTGTKPDAQGTYSLGTGTTVEFTNAAVSTEDIRLTAPTYYNLVVSGTNVANTSLGTGIKFQAGGTFTVKNGGLFKLGNSTGFSGGAATSVANTNNPSIVLEDGSTVEYYGGPAGTNPQIITNVLPYYHLNFSGASAKTAPAAVLTVRGNLSNTGSGFNHNNGTLLLNGTSAQGYNSSGTVLNWYNVNATNAVNVNINGDLAISNLLSLGTTGKLNFTTGNLSLRSNATNTAAVDKISLVNSITYSGAGRFIVERYIPTGSVHGKTWQFLSTPAFGQTVNATWQEGNAPLVVGTAGLGTTLTSEKPGAVSRGYDFYTPAGPSIKTYNDVSNAWSGIDDGATSTASLQLANSKGYMIFVRGDRSVQTSATAANTTTFRTIGKLYSPGTDAPASIPVPAAKFGSIGNPYASAIDFTSVAGISPGIDTKYYAWDPLLAGTLGYGGYQVLSSVTGWVPTPGGTTNYPTGVPYTKIQSGQAFFVYSTPGGNLNFNENNKLTGSQMVFKQNNLIGQQSLRTYLYDQAGSLADGNTVVFDPMFSNDFDADDALKLVNSSENFGISHNDNVLSIDARSPVSDNDTLFYNFTGLHAQPYQLKLVPTDLGLTAHNAFFIDKFSGTSTAISLTDTSLIDFNITTDAASAAPDRFLIVFRVAGPVPVRLLNLTARRTAEKSVAIKWNVENEINIDHYEIERSMDGRSFASIGISPAMLNNGGSSVYNFSDISAPSTAIFYRIRAVGAGSYIAYSNVAKVAGAVISDQGITIYPNPVTDGMIHIYFKNQEAGNYRLQLTNKLGETVYRSNIQIISDDDLQTMPIGKGLSAGSYQLSIIAPSGVKQHQQVVIK